MAVFGLGNHGTVDLDRAELTKNDGNFGLRNVRERLSIHYPDQEPFRIYQEGEWTINKITLG